MPNIVTGDSDYTKKYALEQVGNNAPTDNQWARMLAMMNMSRNMDFGTMLGFGLGKLLRGAWDHRYEANKQKEYAERVEAERQKKIADKQNAIYGANDTAATTERNSNIAAAILNGDTNSPYYPAGKTRPDKTDMYTVSSNEQSVTTPNGYTFTNSGNTAGATPSEWERMARIYGNGGYDVDPKLIDYLSQFKMTNNNNNPNVFNTSNWMLGR